MGGRGSSSGMGGGLMTDESANFGAPGTYQLYRAGDLSAPNGMVFLNASPYSTMAYSHSPLGKVRPTTMEQYEIKIENPLVVQAGADGSKVQAVIEAWKILHPGKDPKVGVSHDRIPPSQWQRLDKQNARALEKSGYDAIIIKGAEMGHEVQIPKSRIKSLKQTNSYDASHKMGDKYPIDKNTYATAIKGPAIGRGDILGVPSTIYRKDTQYYRFDKKKGFVKTKFVEGDDWGKWWK